MIERARSVISFDLHEIDGVPISWAVIHAIVTDISGLTGRCIALGCLILHKNFTIPDQMLYSSRFLIEYMTKQIKQSPKNSSDEELCIFLLRLIAHEEEGFGDIQRSLYIVACRLAHFYKNESYENLQIKAQYIMNQQIPGHILNYEKLASDTTSVKTQWSAVLKRATPAPVKNEDPDIEILASLEH